MTWKQSKPSATQRALDTVGFLMRFMTGESENAAKLPVSAYYYGYMIAQGREFLASELQEDDPFSLSPAEIVERVLAGGYTPYLEGEQRYPIETRGKCDSVERGAQRFLVAVDRTSETISVQEVRTDPYEQRP